MSKSSFLLGVILGGAAATAAAIKLTDITPQELKEAAMEKFDDFMEANDFDTEALKDRAVSSVDELKQRGMELANRANNKFNGDMDDDEDFILDDMAEVPYEQPTEVFMPHKIIK
jgi:gas vesicle protein